MIRNYNNLKIKNKVKKVLEKANIKKKTNLRIKILKSENKT